MLKKIISITFTFIILMVSILTVVSCGTTNLAVGYQKLYYKHAKIASFVAASAVLNDEQEAEQVSQNYKWSKSISQPYLINKYGNMSIDNVFGKDFIVNQNAQSKVKELFETTFGKQNYSFVSKPPEENPTTKSNLISSNDKSGYLAGTTKIDKLVKTIGPLLDTLTAGLNPSTLGIVIDVAWKEADLKKILQPLFRYIIDHKDTVLGVFNDYILDYSPDVEKKKAGTIEEVRNELIAKISEQPLNLSTLVQYIKFTLKVGYSYFDEYLKDNTITYDNYISEYKWSLDEQGSKNNIRDNKIDFTKLTNLFKYITTTNPKLKPYQGVAASTLNPIKTTIITLISKPVGMLLTKYSNEISKFASGFTSEIGGEINKLLASALGYAGTNGPAIVANLIDAFPGLVKYIDSKDEKEKEQIWKESINENIINIVKVDFPDILHNITDKTYIDTFFPILEKALSGLPGGFIKDSLIKAMKSRELLEGLLSSPLYKMIVSIISKALKDLLKDMTMEQIVKPILGIALPLFDQVWGIEPLNKFISSDKFLNQIDKEGNELNSTWALISILRNISIENITLFLAKHFDKGIKNVDYDLNNVKQLVERIAYTKFKIDETTDEIDFEKFAFTSDDDLKDVKKVISTFNKVDTTFKSQDMSKAWKAPYMAFGLNSSSTGVLKDSAGDWLIKSFGGESGDFLYAISRAVQEVLIELPIKQSNVLDDEYFKPLYEPSDWTIDKFKEFANNLPVFVDGEPITFNFVLHRKLSKNKSKNYSVTIRLDEKTNYWEIVKITK